MEIRVNDQIYISEITEGDMAAYIKWFQDREIYENTLSVPFPYGEREAKWWIAAVSEETKKFGLPLKSAIRVNDGTLVGGISLMKLLHKEYHAAEIGFWLAKPYWNKGIMTNVVREYCDWAFRKSGLSLVRIQARVFSFNEAAIKVLERASFEPEGYMRKRFCKDGKYIDAKILSVVTD